ncbi:MAG: Gfo/Idh/MocA family oxidoreductase [Candidatus Hydrogenedentes bacterium]|nr:Gfo/Idh/MocA family oxidoreductase [Candidatus Hydrogenedentota bacterium]
MDSITRYAIVGTGGRHEIYRDALLGVYSKQAELTGLCDSNIGRSRLSAAWIEKHYSRKAPVYSAEHFDDMIRDTRPDVVIVTTKDSMHDYYIVRAMELGCDVITEKPMTIDAARCTSILEMQQRTGRRLRVTFNYRYSPLRTQIKHLLMNDIIGKVVSVDFHWMLDTRHGADYFRRWHRNKENSGGLLVHKATHHFDLINWWLDTTPETVYATGRRAYYTPAIGDQLGLGRRAERCHGCPEAAGCSFYLSLKDNKYLRTLYLEQEQYDKYYRDRCVFSDSIDIEDSMTLAVSYRNGAHMSYSLNAFMPWEGYMVVFNGTKGRLEHKCEGSVYINGDGSVPGSLKREGSWIRVYPHFAPAYEEFIWEASGGHGGGDKLLLQDLFAPDSTEDPYGRRADQYGGAWSILTGIAANLSIQNKMPVHTLDLVPLLTDKTGCYLK